MKVLFLHPNFPAQFRHLATVLGADPQHQVTYITACEEGDIPGVQKLLYEVTYKPSSQTHRYVRPLEKAVSNGQAAWRTAHRLKEKLGFEPDVIYAHVGWGPGLFMRDLFPQTRYIGLFEWYYRAHGSNIDFDPADPVDSDTAARIHVRNAAILLELARCDAGVVPTHWQKQQFPPEFHHKLHVLHDGVDLDYCYPDSKAKLTLPFERSEEEQRENAKEKKTKKEKKKQGFGQAKAHKPKPVKKQEKQIEPVEVDELVTYVARGMEPYRGFPQFMAAVEKLQKIRPHCHTVIVGEDRVAYGEALKDGRTYREKALAELDLDMSRLHFTGPLTYGKLQQVYRASSVHVYLTYPFVLSWSMLEAMASGCVVLGSKTPPVEEVITHGKNGFLVDFWDVDAIASELNTLLDNQTKLTQVRQQARQTIEERYSLAKLLPQQISILLGKTA